MGEIDGAKIGSAQVAGGSALGMRASNEDSILACRRHDDWLFAVADGMGQHPHGELVSSLGVSALAALFYDPSSCPNQTFNLEQSFYLANRSVRENPALQPYKERLPGSTLAALHLRQNILTVASVGDSRIYRYNAREGFSILTPDDGGFWLGLRHVVDNYPGDINGSLLNHFFKNEMVKVYGKLAWAKGDILDYLIQHQALPSFPLGGQLATSYYNFSKVHPLNNLIDQFLGKETVNPHVTSLPFFPGDVYFLLTDGFEELEPDQFVRTVDSTRDKPALETYRRLAELFLPDDNFSGILVKLPL